jgi:hypothetical protein
MTLRPVYLATLFALLPPYAVAQPPVWQTFVIEETGAKVDIPISIFTKETEKPPGGYGRHFLTSDGRANFTVESFPNTSGDSPALFLAKKKPPAGIIYKKVTSRFFVASSILDDRIWYNRCNRTGGYMQCVLINYPAAEKRQWDGVVTRISNSLASK